MTQKCPRVGFLSSKHRASQRKKPLSTSTFHLVLNKAMTTALKHQNGSKNTRMAQRSWQKLVWAIYLFENKSSTSHLPQLSPSTNSEGFTRGVGSKALKERILLVFKNVTHINLDILLVSVFRRGKEGGT